MAAGVEVLYSPVGPDDLAAFNRAIIGEIEVISSFGSADNVERNQNAENQ